MRTMLVQVVLHYIQGPLLAYDTDMLQIAFG